MLGIFAGLIFAAQTVMPFAIVNRIIEEFNTNGISAVLRADNILDYQMSYPDDTFGLTQFQKDSLKEQEILPLDYGGGTVLAYKVSFPSTPNEWKIVHATTPASPNIGDLQNQYTSTYSGFSFNRVTLVTIDEAMDDGDFKNPYTAASKTWRGGNSGWYDTLTSLNESIRDFRRSRFFASGANKASIITSAAARNIMKGKTITGIQTTRDIKDQTYTWSDSDGEHTGVTKVETSTSGSKTGVNKAALKAASVVSTVSKLATGYCMYVETASRIQSIVQAIASLQQMNLITGYTEAVQKVQIGEDSGGVAMHEYANNLVTTPRQSRRA